MARFDAFSEEMVRGDTHSFTLIVRDEGGAAVDLTTYASLRFTASDMLGDPTPVMDLTEPTNLTRSSPESGAVTVTVLPANTNSLENARWALYAELRAESAAGAIRRLQGTLIVKPRVRGTA